MTIWEKLFGDPTRASETIEYLDQIDACDFMSRVMEEGLPPEKCKYCIFEYDRYGCEHKDMTLLDWLRQEID